jgi:hypothetical protein
MSWLEIDLRQTTPALRYAEGSDCCGPNPGLRRTSDPASGVLFVLLILALSCGCTDHVPTTVDPVTPVWQSWSSQRLGMSLRHPPDWSIRQSLQADLLLAAPQDSPTDEFTESLALTREDVSSSGASLTTYVARALEELSGEPNFKLIESTATTIAGRPARRLVYLAFGPTTQHAAHPFLFDQTVVLRSTSMYVFTLSCESESAYVTYKPIVRSIEATVQFNEIGAIRTTTRAE